MIKKHLTALKGFNSYLNHFFYFFINLTYVVSTVRKNEVNFKFSENIHTITHGYK